MSYNNVKTNIIRVNNVIDSQAADTDITHGGYIPQDKVEFVVAIKRLINSNPDLNYSSVFKLIKQTIQNCNNDNEYLGEQYMISKKLENILRKKIRGIIKEAKPSFDQGAYGPEDFERDKEWLKQRLGRDINKTNKKVKKRGSEEEQAKNIISSLQNEFGISMSSSAFQNFDKATKLRWAATAYLSERDPQFVERIVTKYIEALETAADESGILDDELIEELKELEEVLLENPGATPAFAEFLQSNVQNEVNAMSEEEFNNLMSVAEVAFSSVPGGVMKYTRSGEKEPSHVRDWMKRRQTSKQFTGGGSPETGGGTVTDRFAAALSSKKWPPEK